MAGAAIIIGLQQLKGLLGIANFTHNTDIISVMISVFRGLNHNQVKSYSLSPKKKKKKGKVIFVLLIIVIHAMIIRVY